MLTPSDQKNELQSVSELQSQIAADPPYRFDKNKYTPEEIEQFRSFMHKEFEHLSLPWKGGTELTIGFPPSEICTKDEWKHLVETMLAPDLENFHPEMRQRKITVRFVDNLIDTVDGPMAGGNAWLDEEKNEYYVRIANYRDNDAFISKEWAIFVLLHEIWEQECIWQLSQEARDHMEKPEVVQKEAAFLLDTKENPAPYWTLPDESYANRHATKALRRLWPDFKCSVAFGLPDPPEEE